MVSQDRLPIRLRAFDMKRFVIHPCLDQPKKKTETREIHINELICQNPFGYLEKHTTDNAFNVLDPTKKSFVQ